MARMVKSANSNGSGEQKYPDPNRKADYRPGGMYSSGRAIPPGPGTKKNTRVTTPKPSKPSGINRNTKVTSAKPSKPTKRIPTSMASAMPKRRASSKPKPQSMAGKYRG